jgi:hypothetical protein
MASFASPPSSEMPEAEANSSKLFTIFTTAVLWLLFLPYRQALAAKSEAFKPQAPACPDSKIPAP